EVEHQESAGRATAAGTASQGGTGGLGRVDPAGAGVGPDGAAGGAAVALAGGTHAGGGPGGRGGAEREPEHPERVVATDADGRGDQRMNLPGISPVRNRGVP